MKKLVLALAALTLATPAFAGTKAPAAVPASTVVDASGKPIGTEKGGNVTIATAEPAAPAVAPAPVKHVKKKHVAAKPKAKPAAKAKSAPVATPAQ